MNFFLINLDFFFIENLDPILRLILDFSSVDHLATLCLRHKKIHRLSSTFSRRVSLVEQRTDKILGGSVGFFLNGFARTGKTTQNESGVASPLAAPLRAIVVATTGYSGYSHNQFWLEYSKQRSCYISHFGFTIR